MKTYLRSSLLAICLLAGFTTQAAAEVQADAKLVELMDMLESMQYVMSQRPNPVVNACFYTVFKDWEKQYVLVMEQTKFTGEAGIKNREEYGYFAASVALDMHRLEANFPNIFQNVKLYIGQNRKDRNWPRGPQGLNLNFIDDLALSDNLIACYNSRIARDLGAGFSVPDVKAGDSVANDRFTAGFEERPGKAGLTLCITRNDSQKFSIPGIGVSDVCISAKGQ